MTEKILENKKHGMRALIIIIALYAAGIAAMIIGGIGMANAVDYVSTPFGVGAVNSVAKHNYTVLFVIGCIWVCIGWVPIFGLKVLKPQEALVLTLFGNYVGTLKGEGFYFVNPFCVGVNPAAKTKLNQSGDVDGGGAGKGLSLNLSAPDVSAAAAQSGSVTYQNQQAEDITTRYMDTEARLASLTAQRTRLQELQAQADTLADLLEIESSLSDVQYQIESWQSQLDWYSNQVSCCTVYITLNEVETLTPTSTSFGAKLLAALRNGWTGFVSGAQAVAVFLVGAWPAILIGAVCGVIYYRVRHPRKKK